MKNGLKPSSKDGPTARTPLAQTWLGAIGSLHSEDLLQQGLEYARAGQIVSLQVLAGELDGLVQGTAARPYSTHIHVPALNEAKWSELIEAMADEAIYGAKLLSGELPPAMATLFEAHQAWLVPDHDRLTCSCSCVVGRAGASCKHSAAVAHLFADMLSEQPLTIFTLLGLPATRLIERLRQTRIVRAHGVASAHGELAASVDRVQAAPLEEVLEGFWRGDTSVDAGDCVIEVRQPQVRHALLRRLGPSPLKGKFPLVGLLASIYDEVSSAALNLNDDVGASTEEPTSLGDEARSHGDAHALDTSD